jgi:serine/threonine-protein kinase
VFKARQTIGKYRIERRLAEGGFAVVYRALDQIEGVRVALKIPRQNMAGALDDFRREVRLAAKLDHPNILPLKNAEFVEGHFVVVFALGEKTLADRLQTRLATRTALDYAEQMLEAVACAHRHRIIHCDVKPENLILFAGDRLRLTDFGIAKMALRTVRASGSGTMGYMAPEQAMGKPSFRSDVFSAGLILYRMLAGHLPEWPFEWPPPRYERLRGRVHPDLIELIRRSLELDPKKRFRDGNQMRAAFRRVKPRALSFETRRKKSAGTGRDWKTVRRRQFQRQYGRQLETRHQCEKCEGPVSEAMAGCPWCGAERKVHHGPTRFPAHCPRCRRGMKLDWRFCPWCYGPGFEPHTTRRYTDKRYTARCANPRCERKELMPFMRYCPWCHRKVRKKWEIVGSRDKCSRCGWGVLPAYWSHCPWCRKEIGN